MSETVGAERSEKKRSDERGEAVSRATVPPVHF
jgi:hypothetical protein